MEGWGVVWRGEGSGGGGGGVLGTQWKPLNTSKTLARAARRWGWGRRGFGHTIEAFKHI